MDEATLELAAVVFLLLYVWRRIDAGKYRFFLFPRLDSQTARLLSRISAPIAGQRLLENLRWIIFFLIFERVSTSALAIANIVFTCYIVFSIPMQGFSETACSMVSRFIGRDRAHRIGEVLRSITRGAIFGTVPFIALALFAPQWLVAAFSPESDLLAQSNASLHVVDWPC